MFDVLQTKAQISEARTAMEQQGISGLHKENEGSRQNDAALPVGDWLKSWDVARTLNFIESRLPKNAAILDLGAYCSEVPVSLAKMDYSRVHGVDLNPGLAAMPYADIVKYSVSDFMDTPFPSESFDAITAISVIEHGYQPDRLFAEVKRLLKPKGYFIASFDYWQQKIDTGDTKFFDMDWLIFSEEDVKELLHIASLHDMKLLGDFQPMASSERPIHCVGFGYTFGWIVLQKN